MYNTAVMPKVMKHSNLLFCAICTILRKTIIKAGNIKKEPFCSIFIILVGISQIAPASCGASMASTAEINKPTAQVYCKPT